ncbi:Putative carbohydrate-binding WSC [Colletotrichum destructivum]|uniref:Carbohydrate-binding WSC n=1 Tax=Colletotrichum destructivum TaxID=34406 RepID=A0AAX4I8D8_9PEZI|nr:Putative carbohydrate-binding WSC [Colletotrichum destructivum]
MRSIAVIALMGQVVLGQQFTNSSTSSTTSSTSTTFSTSRTTTTTLITTTDSTITDDGSLTFGPDPPTTTDTTTTVTSTTLSTTTTSGSSSASSTSTVTPNPANVGGYSLLGCYGSPTSFPGFALTLSAESMTIDRCIAACSPISKRYAGLFGNDCFCGDVIDDVNEPNRPEAECNFPCPGNPRQRCGGRSIAILKNKRQILPTDVRFTIYVSGSAIISVSGTVTVTVSTGTGIIGTATAITPTPSPNPCFNGKCFGVPCFGLDCYKKFVAYGDFCGYDFPCFGPDCRKRLVWEHGVWRPDACNGWDCGRKVKCVSGKCKIVVKGSDWDKEKITCYGNICKVEKCDGDECNKKYVCKDKSCVFETCPKEEGNKKWECESDKCKVVKPCEDDCPEPAPPGPLAPGATSVQPPAGPDATAVPTSGDDAEATAVPTSGGDDDGDASVLPVPTDGDEDATALPTPTDDETATGPAPTGPQPTDGSGAGSGAGSGGSGPDGPSAPTASGTGRPPVVVVAAGSNKFVASFGALAFSVIAAAILL